MKSWKKALFAVLAVAAVAIPTTHAQIFERIAQNRQARISARSTKVVVPPVVSQNCVGGECLLPTVVPNYSYTPGASVVMVGQTAAPNVGPAVQLSAIETKQSFRRTLLSAVAAARKKGDVSAREAFRIRVASFSPAFLDQVEELCVVQMVFSGEADQAIPRSADGKVDRTSIDWEKFASFLERMIPLILQIISAFGL